MDTKLQEKYNAMMAANSTGNIAHDDLAFKTLILLTRIIAHLPQPQRNHAVHEVDIMRHSLAPNDDAFREYLEALSAELK